ncbi:hypothetical protein [Salinicola sp. CR57]|uniref:hypothetical protein n=1 Tax=Salinicola sp. CR57 TaxID=1949086 RepID=UPI0013004869|nr:hypothetical protein [Salinicola sp. CR57]
MKTIRNLTARAVPPIERWPNWLAWSLSRLARYCSRQCRRMAIAMVVALVPATYHVGITREAIVLWGYGLLFIGAALWFAHEAAWIDSTRGSQP